MDPNTYEQRMALHDALHMFIECPSDARQKSLETAIFAYQDRYSLSLKELNKLVKEEEDRKNAQPKAE